MLKVTFEDQSLLLKRSDAIFNHGSHLLVWFVCVLEKQGYPCFSSNAMWETIFCLIKI